MPGHPSPKALKAIVIVRTGVAATTQRPQSHDLPHKLNEDSGRDGHVDDHGQQQEGRPNR